MIRAFFQRRAADFKTWWNRSPSTRDRVLGSFVGALAGLWVAVSVLAIHALSNCVSKPTLESQQTEFEVENLTYDAALLGTDASVLRELYAEDFRYIGLNNVVHSKNKQIETLTSGELDLTDGRISDVVIRIYETTAVLTERFMGRVRAAGGEDAFTERYSPSNKPPVFNKYVLYGWVLKAILLGAAIYLLFRGVRYAWRFLTRERVPSRRTTPYSVTEKDNVRLFGYHIEYVSPAILRAGEHDSIFLYVDAMGRITFRSLESRHPSGGSIDFPLNDDDWDRRHPGHRGHRDLVRRRLIEFAERGGRHSQVVQALKRSGMFWM